MFYFSVLIQLALTKC